MRIGVLATAVVDNFALATVGDVQRRVFFAPYRFPTPPAPGDRVLLAPGTTSGPLVALYVLGRGAVTA